MAYLILNRVLSSAKPKGLRGYVVQIQAHAMRWAWHPAQMLLFLGFHRHNFTLLVEPAIGADPVRQNRLIALAAVLNLDRLEVEVATPLALSGVRRPPLGNSHESLPFSCLFELKSIIVGRLHWTVKFMLNMGLSLAFAIY